MNKELKKHLKGLREILEYNGGFRGSDSTLMGIDAELEALYYNTLK